MVQENSKKLPKEVTTAVRRRQLNCFRVFEEFTFSGQLSTKAFSLGGGGGEERIHSDSTVDQGG